MISVECHRQCSSSNYHKVTWKWTCLLSVNLAVLVGREPAGRGLSSPGTALALLSAASLTGAASLTTVAASLSEPAALSATPSFAMSAYVRRLRPATFTLFSVAVSSSLLLFFRRLGIVTCTAATVVARRIRNDQFGQLIGFISGYSVSDHAGSPSSQWITVGMLPQLCHEKSVLGLFLLAMDYVNTIEVPTDASHLKAFHTACRKKTNLGLLII
ncbi:hypothetical protein T09_4110 [Trichinella sp. T9]|nr:hypothetical protein T09_4110 [Trichinella sp. T9]